jgi:hypothetical protein
MIDLLDAASELRVFEVKNLVLLPREWASLSLPTSLTWTTRRLATTPAADIPKDKRGVYTFVVQPNIACHPHCAYLLYVGKAAGESGFRARYGKYLAEKAAPTSKRPLVHRMVNLWFDYLWFSFAEVDDSQITATEDKLLAAFRPPMNTEFPASISAAMRAFA